MVLKAWLGFVCVVSVLGSSYWITEPVLDPFADSRATGDSILMTWTPGSHVEDALSHYELRVRWPLVVEASDFMLHSQATPDGYFPSERVQNREWAKVWAEYALAYSGRGRQFNFSIPNQLSEVNGTIRVFDFQVRAINILGDASQWSPPVLGHTLLENTQERFLVELIGTGRNNAMFSQITVNGVSLFNKTDLRGLALAVFNRSDFSLKNLDSYDVFIDAAESRRMVADLRSLAGPGTFIAIVSGHAWEWRLSSQLATVLETYGAFYVGQWARIFETASIRPSTYADLAETSSSDSFGHPYALFGSYGLGMGNGIESIQLNTGHYLATGKAQRAIIRLQVYYNYMLGRFFVNRYDSKSSDFFVKSQNPPQKTLHNPISADQTVLPAYQVQPQSRYAPYIGNLYNQLEYVMEANETVVWDEFNSTNFGFEIIQVLEKISDPLVTGDPRTGDLRQTEMQRIWPKPPICAEMIGERHSLSFDSLCPDYDDPELTTHVPLMRFGIGVFPTLCNPQNPDCASPVPTLETFSSITPFSSWTSATVSTIEWLP